MGEVVCSARGLVAAISCTCSVVHHWSGAELDDHMHVEATCSRFAVIIPTLKAAYEPVLVSCGDRGVSVYRTVFRPQPRSSMVHDFSVHARKCSKST